MTCLSPSTEILLSKLTRQDFWDFVQLERDRAVRLAAHLCGDAANAEDLAQDAFVKAHENWQRFRGDSSRRTWFTRILVNTVHSHRRRVAVAERWQRLWGRSDAVEAAADAHGSDDETRRRINQALAKLTSAQRDAFCLVHLEQMTVEETAKALGKAPGTIKSHLHRALASMRSSLADLWENKP